MGRLAKNGLRQRNKKYQINKKVSIFFILDFFLKITHDTRHCSSEECKKKKEKEDEKVNEKKLDYITIGTLHITYTKFCPMYSIYINYFILIIYNGYDNLVHRTLT